MIPINAFRANRSQIRGVQYSKYKKVYEFLYSLLILRHAVLMNNVLDAVAVAISTVALALTGHRSKAIV